MSNQYFAAKRARFEAEDAASLAMEQYKGSRFVPYAEMQNKRLALEDLREKYQRNYCLIFQLRSTDATWTGSRIDTDTNNLLEWYGRKGAMITIRSLVVEFNSDAVTEKPLTIPMEVFIGIEQDNMFKYDVNEKRWLANSLNAQIPITTSENPAGGATQSWGIYQAQGDNLNVLYVPAPFTKMTVELRDVALTGAGAVALASTQLIGQAAFAIKYFKLVVDVQFVE